MSADILEVLTAAKALIADPKRWTRGTYARTKDGKETFATGPDAACFCVAGAVRRALSDAGDINFLHPGHRAYAILARGFCRDSGGDSKVIAMYNDLPETTHADVMAAFDFAIDWVTPEEEAVTL